MTIDANRPHIEVCLSDTDHEQTELAGFMHLTKIDDGSSLYVLPGGVKIDGKWWHEVVRPNQ